jgi:hypothetical protein
MPHVSSRPYRHVGSHCLQMSPKPSMASLAPRTPRPWTPKPKSRKKTLRQDRRGAWKLSCDGTRHGGLEQQDHGLLRIGSSRAWRERDSARRGATRRDMSCHAMAERGAQLELRMRGNRDLMTQICHCIGQHRIACHSIASHCLAWHCTATKHTTSRVTPLQCTSKGKISRCVCVCIQTKKHD